MFSKEQLQLGLAFFAIYFVWGSTYLANYWAIHSIPPFLMGGSRFLVAGTFLLAIITASRAIKITLRQLKNAVILGVLFIAIGTGGIVWSEQFLDTGLVALIVTFEPLLIVLFIWAFKRERPSWGTIAGIALGFIGIALLVGQPSLTDDPDAWLGLTALVISMCAWSVGAVIAADMELPKSPWTNTAVQMFSGGLVLTLVGTVYGEWAILDFAAIDTRAIAAWFYLVVFGAIITFTAFQYLIQKVPPHLVATSNYVNPVVALLLGWLLNSELVTYQSIVASVILIAGVIAINFKTAMHWRKQRKLNLPRNVLIQYLPKPNASMPHVARIWKAALHPNRLNDYVALTKQEIDPVLKKTPGLVGYRLEKLEGDEFQFVTLWEEIDAVKNLGIDDVETVRLFPGEAALLAKADAKVVYQSN